MKRKHLILWVVLVLSMLVLSGCGVPREGVDVTNVPPQNVWQTAIVWPLAKALIWLNTLLEQIDLPYSWGFAIILFTVIIKVITFPLTMTQVRGMQAQKKLQPKLQELQKKYGKDREKLAQEQMKLYQEAGVNPLSGCLPLLVQMPVLFGLYSALIALGPTLDAARFFWIPDLGFPHYTAGLSWIPELFSAGDYARLGAYLVLPILLMASQVVMQKYTTMATPTAGGDGQAGMMKQMTTIMSLMFGFFTLQVPAGLTLYWVTSNLLQVGQQYFVMKVQDDDEDATAASTSKSAANTSPNGKTETKETKVVAENKSRRSRRQRKRK